MKYFTTIKNGYTAGITGCTNEFFTTIWSNGGKHGSFAFKGMYGAEDRVNGTMKRKGYKEFYTPSTYGQLKKTDNIKWHKYEHEAIAYVKSGEFLKHGNN